MKTKLLLLLATTIAHTALTMDHSYQPIEKINAEGFANTKDSNGNTPMHLLAQLCMEYQPEKAARITTRFIEVGMNPLIKNNAGETPEDVVTKILQDNPNCASGIAIKEIINAFTADFVEGYRLKTQSENAQLKS